MKLSALILCIILSAFGSFSIPFVLFNQKMINNLSALCLAGGIFSFIAIFILIADSLCEKIHELKGS